MSDVGRSHGPLGPCDPRARWGPRGPRALAERVASAALVVGVALGAGTSCDAPATDFAPQWSTQAPRLWALVNLSAGQTAFSEDALEIRGMAWGRTDGLHPSATFEDLPWISLLAGPARAPVPFELTLLDPRRGRFTLRPEGGFTPDTDYVLAFPRCALQPHIDCPPPTPFSTTSAPRVLGLWRVESTLFVVFSEAMDPTTLSLAHGSVDLRLQGGASVVATRNLSGYTWDTRGSIFRLAPLPEDAAALIVGATVRSAAGTALDVDGDGAPEAPPRSAVIPFYPAGLSECFTREDRPEPCLSGEAAAVKSASFTLEAGQQPDVP